MRENGFNQMEEELTRKLEDKTIVNVGSRSEDKSEQMLSNFARASFVFNGTEYPSIEAFWQSLKFPEGSLKRFEVAQMENPARAKRYGKKAREIDQITFNGRIIGVGSFEHHMLAKKVIRAKLEQNPEIVDLLLDTDERPIVHILTDTEGRILPDSKTLPRDVFARILMELREEFKSKRQMGQL